MGWRGDGWRASLTSFSPSVDSATHPRTGTQMRRASTSLAVISNKRMIMALVKTPPTLLCLLSHGQGSHSARITWPGRSNLSISILRRQSAIAHPSLPIISLFGQALWVTKPSGPWKRMSESARVQTCTHVLLYIFIWVREWERESGRWVLMCIWAGRTIVLLHFY